MHKRLLCDGGVKLNGRATFTNAHTSAYTIKGIVVIKMMQTHKKPCASQEKCLFSEAVSSSSSHSPSKIRASPARRVSHATAESLEVKRCCLLFLKEYENTQTFPATAAFLKCNFCLSFCRVFRFHWRIPRKSAVMFLHEINIKCGTQRSHHNCTVRDPLSVSKILLGEIN